MFAYKRALGHQLPNLEAYTGPMPQNPGPYSEQENQIKPDTIRPLNTAQVPLIPPWAVCPKPQAPILNAKKSRIKPYISFKSPCQEPLIPPSDPRTRLEWTGGLKKDVDAQVSYMPQGSLTWFRVLGSGFIGFPKR